MKLAFIGIGNVGFAIANNLQKKGHDIIVASNSENSQSVQKALKENSNFLVMNIQSAIDEAEIVFLATPFQANESILKSVNFNDKILVDCTNPVGMGISHGLKSEISGSEKVQEWAPEANVVKAFTIYGFENFIDSNYPNYNVKPIMLIAGNNIEAKSLVQKINSDMGFDTLDTGNLDQALHLEHMTLLWVKIARRDGHHPNFVWAMLEK
ncbi:NADPH-dependent F420 reductase [Flavobacterium luteum]|uniref:NADPH-dependent F420 reductase n=1 Tax=Flavobacterium luteum TaxID=2026654 RepID=A0A7J5ALG6_9FLAO|nr:NADPH-dependent F420 reductase [Flavobacterium luteum]KAB1157819.1 NADPH-dependent F420 reductase [Flavobacterium luteum]